MDHMESNKSIDPHILTWAHLFNNISVFVKPQSKACYRVICTSNICPGGNCSKDFWTQNPFDNIFLNRKLKNLDSCQRLRLLSKLV